MLRLRPVSMSHRAARTWTLSATVALAMQHGRPCVSVRIPAPPYSSSGSSIGCDCSRDARVAFLRGCGMPSGVKRDMLHQGRLGHTQLSRFRSLDER